MDVSTDASVAGTSNVLFEPEIYRPVAEPVADDRMVDEEDHLSVSTHAGVNASLISTYKTDLDPALF